MLSVFTVEVLAFSHENASLLYIRSNNLTMRYSALSMLLIRLVLVIYVFCGCKLFCLTPLWSIPFESKYFITLWSYILDAESQEVYGSRIVTTSRGPVGPLKFTAFKLPVSDHHESWKISSLSFFLKDWKWQLLLSLTTTELS